MNTVFTGQIACEATLPRCSRASLLLALLLAALLAGCGTGNLPTQPAGPTSPAAVGPIATPTPTRVPVQIEAALTTVPPRAAQSALESIRERGQVRVGVLYNYPPLGYLADSGQMHGYEVDLMRSIAQRWGIEPVFVQVTRQTRLPMLVDGEVDMLAAAVPHRRELEQFVEFSDTVFQSGYVALVRSGTGYDLAGAFSSGPVAAVGEEARQAAEERARQLGVAVQVQPYDSREEAVAALTGGGVSAVVGRRESLMLSLTVGSELEILGEFVLLEPYAFATRRGDVPLRDLLNLTLQEIIREGEIGTIFSANFYGLPSDLFATQTGDPAFDLASLPVTIPAGPGFLDRARGGEPLRVAGLDLSTEPALFDGQTIVDGYNRAVINEMARRWGVQVIEVPSSAGQAGLEMLVRGEVDLVVGVQPDLSLIGTVALSVPYYDRGLRLIHLQDVPVANVLDLEFKPVMAVSPADLSQKLIEENNDFPRVQVASSASEAFEALLARGIYAIVGDEYVLTLMARADPRIVMDERRYRPQGFSIALPRFDSDFRTLVNFTLQDMLQDGTLETLRQQYFAPYLPEGQSLEPLQIEIWPGDGSFLGVGG